MKMNIACLRWFFYVTCIHATLGNNATLKDYERLINDAIHAYDNRVRPLANQSKAIEVYMTFNFLNVLEINDVQQEIKLNAWLNFSWIDEIRKWNSSDYGGIDVIHPNPLDTWLPRVIVSNSLEKRDVFGDSYAPTAIHSTGEARWFPGTVFTLSCDLDMTYFPFDRQICQVRIMGKDHPKSVFLTFSEAAVRVGAYAPNGEWDFVSHESVHDVLNLGPLDSFCRLTVRLVFERRPTFYVINILIPITFLSLLSFLGFIIPEESGERSSFAITVLLSLAVFMTIVSGQVPATSNTLPIIVTYIFGLVVLSGVSVIAIVVHYRIKMEFSNTCTAPSSPEARDGEDRHRREQMSEHRSEESNAVDEEKLSNHDVVSDVKGNGLWAKLSEVLRSLGKTVINVLKKGDVQMFLIFTIIWLFYILFFLHKLLSKSD